MADVIVLLIAVAVRWNRIDNRVTTRFDEKPAEEVTNVMNYLGANSPQICCFTKRGCFYAFGSCLQFSDLREWATRNEQRDAPRCDDDDDDVKVVTSQIIQSYH